ncbi:MAG TPA: glycosyltransferase family 1 protein [Candidatus Omnitrophica bacterium]|nr:glycosyltransferase family 1 protein [Candidatus Omnitrophota bacterium]
MNILQIIGSKNIGGGSQEHTRLLSCGLKFKGHAVTVVCREGSLVEAYREEGLKVIALELRDRIKAIKFLTRLIKQRKFDVVHTHNRDGDIAGLIAAKLTSTPVIVSTIHSYINQDKFGDRKMNFPLWLYNNILTFLPHRIVAVSEALRKHILEELRVIPEKLICIMNAVDLNGLKCKRDKSELRRELNIPQSSKVIGSVGKLIIMKGYRYLVESAVEILSEVPDVRFLIIGDGNQREVLQRKVKEYGIQKRFMFLGERQDAIEIMQSFDIFVHPSLSEGLPRVVMEAQGLGVPVVATSVGGTPEVVEDGKTGILVSPKDPVAQSRAILSLLRDSLKRKRMGEAGKRRIEEKFSHTRMIDEIEALFFYLLGR